MTEIIEIAILAGLGLFIIIAGLSAVAMEHEEYKTLHNARAKEVADFLEWAKKRGDPEILKIAEEMRQEIEGNPRPQKGGKLGQKQLHGHRRGRA